MRRYRITKDNQFGPDGPQSGAIGLVLQSKWDSQDFEGGPGTMLHFVVFKGYPTYYIIADEYGIGEVIEEGS